MSRRETVVLMSRALAVVQIVSALLEASYLPQSLTSLWEHVAPLRSANPFDYWSRYYFEGTLALVLRIAILLLAAQILWKCGPKIEGFLLPAAESETPAQAV
jgi:hypothetical protein